MMWMLPPSLSALPPSHEAMAGQDGGTSRRFYNGGYRGTEKEG